MHCNKRNLQEEQIPVVYTHFKCFLYDVAYLHGLHVHELKTYIYCYKDFTTQNQLFFSSDFVNFSPYRKRSNEKSAIFEKSDTVPVVLRANQIELIQRRLVRNFSRLPSPIEIHFKHETFLQKEERTRLPLHALISRILCKERAIRPKTRSLNLCEGPYKYK